VDLADNVGFFICSIENSRSDGGTHGRFDSPWRRPSPHHRETSACVDQSIAIIARSALKPAAATSSSRFQPANGDCGGDRG